MQSSTSTSIHEAHSSPVNTIHRRLPSSYTADLQDSNSAGRPFAFVPKRRSSTGSPAAHTLSEDTGACTSPPQGQIRLVQQPSFEDSAMPQTTPRGFCTFPRTKPEPSRARLSQSDTELVRSTPHSEQPDAPTEADISGRPTLLLSDRQNVPSEVDHARTPTSPHPVSAVSPADPSSAFLLRKKSGELVKPSLKSTGFATWAVPGSARARTKSAPTTPMGPKSVHFDAHLEHVKLFLAEQKPLAVSRDGSPTETSEGDTTDPGFPFPRVPSKSLRLRPIILPSPPSDPWTFDVRLEKLSLEDTALVGQVLVRNIAFGKWVAVRFTLDAWQTTSEVAARHIASLRGNTFDRFEFRIRLGDYMIGIEFKRFVLCVRFSVEGREMWDSNGGRNYEVGFERVREDPAMQMATSPSAARNVPSLMTDLRKQLEKVVQNVEDGSPSPATALNRRTPRGLRVWLGDRDLGDEDDPTPPFRSRSPSPIGDQKSASATPSLSNKDVPLSARYDFGASLRSPSWTPPEAHTRPFTAHSTTHKPRTTLRRPKPPPPPTSSSTTAVQFPRAGHRRRSLTMPLDGGPTGYPRDTDPHGSPRDAADFADEGVEEHRRSQGDDAYDDGRPRRHSRGWVRGSSFEQIAKDTSPLKKTPPGMPKVIPPTPPRRSEFHVKGEESSSSSSSSPSVSPSTSRELFNNAWQALRRNDDEISNATPSFSSSSTPTTLSPLSPLGELPRALSDDTLVTATSPRRRGAQRPPINSTPYYSLLDQFCFFTGVSNYYPHSNNTAHGTPPRRVQSASTVEDYFSLSPPHHDDVQSPLSSASTSSSVHTNRIHSPIPAEFSSSRGLMTSS